MKTYSIVYDISLLKCGNCHDAICKIFAAIQLSDCTLVLPYCALDDVTLVLPYCALDDVTLVLPYCALDDVTLVLPYCALDDVTLYTGIAIL